MKHVGMPRGVNRLSDDRAAGRWIVSALLGVMAIGAWLAVVCFFGSRGWK